MKASIICLIDDDEVYQFSFTRQIKSSQIVKKIQIFSEAENALQFLTDNITNAIELPDVIFLDLNMPVMDGWEFLEEFTKIKPKLAKKITIYIVSSSVDEVDIERSRKISNVSDYIIKPINLQQFEEIIKNLPSN